MTSKSKPKAPLGKPRRAPSFKSAVPKPGDPTPLAASSAPQRGQKPSPLWDNHPDFRAAAVTHRQLPEPRKLAALQPRWCHRTDGARAGIAFVCPACPAYTCVQELRWDEREPLPGENRNSLEFMTLLQPLRRMPSFCTTVFKIEQGHVVATASSN